MQTNNTTRIYKSCPTFNLITYWTFQYLWLHLHPLESKRNNELWIAATNTIRKLK